MHNNVEPGTCCRCHQLKHLLNPYQTEDGTIEKVCLSCLLRQAADQMEYMAANPEATVNCTACGAPLTLDSIRMGAYDLARGHIFYCDDCSPRDMQQFTRDSDCKFGFPSEEDEGGEFGMGGDWWKAG